MSRRRKSRRTSVRVTRTKGSSVEESHRTGGLSITGFGPTGRVSSPRPTIRATVRDQGASLSREDIRLYVDGTEKSRFHYDPGSGRLSFRVGRRLPPGVHRVEIEAGARSGDDQGRLDSNASRRWTFTVARRESGRRAG